jgi:hypothetical protein
MEAIICQNDARELVQKIQEYVEGGGIIKSLRIVDFTDDQVVLLVGEEDISQQMAEIFWKGWQAALA